MEAIAAIEDIDPTDFQANLGIRLYDRIEPEALDRLVTGSRNGATVTVDLTLHNKQQYVVRIHDNGQLIVQKVV